MLKISLKIQNNLSKNRRNYTNINIRQIYPIHINKNLKKIANKLVQILRKFKNLRKCSNLSLKLNLLKTPFQQIHVSLWK